MSRTSSFAALAVLLGLLAAPLMTCATAQTFTDAAKAGDDYKIQGEYVGTIKTDDGEVKRGAQVIALGDGKFQAVGYAGGLPGDGWKRGDEMVKCEGALKDGVVTLAHDNVVGTLKDGIIKVAVDGKECGELKKVERKSPTIDAKPPAGALVLFDGSGVDQWVNGKLTEDKLLAPSNVETKEKFGDHTLHIEFRTPFMPKARGQSRGNSGVYMQGRYELQVLDSFGLEGENNECGGIYQIAKPIVNGCLPPLAWQTYDIEFTAAKYDAAGKKTANARVTIKHNGITIHDNLELPKETPGWHKEGPGPDGIFLQNHGNPVAFRNIWVVKK